MRDILVDPQSYELAAHFLSDDDRTSEKAHEVRVMSLARTIQQAVEDWCENEDRCDRDPHDDDGLTYGHPADMMDEIRRG